MTNNPILFFPAPVAHQATWLEELAAAEMTQLARTIAVNDERIFDYVTGRELHDDPHIGVQRGTHYGEARWQSLAGTQLSNGYVVEVRFIGRRREHVSLMAVLDPDMIPEVVPGA